MRQIFLVVLLSFLAQAETKLRFEVKPVSSKFALPAAIAVTYDPTIGYKIILPQIGRYRIDIRGQSKSVTVDQKSGAREVILHGANEGDAVLISTRRVAHRIWLPRKASFVSGK